MKNTPRKGKNVSHLLSKPAGSRTPEECAEIAEANIGLMYKPIKAAFYGGKTTTTLGWEDYEQEAYYALQRAAAAFDPARGLQFSTLAIRYIRNQLWDAFNKDLHPVGGARSKDKGSKRLAWVESYHEMAERYSAAGSDEPMTPDDLQFMGSGEHEDFTDAGVDYERKLEALRKLNLTDKQREVLNLKLKGWTFGKIGMELGISSETARITWLSIETRVQRAVERV